MTAVDSIEVDGYKSIRSAKIDLAAVNVLIGANGAGKSNLLGLFGLLADLADDRLQLHIGRQGGADAILHFGRKKTPALRISLRFGLRGYEAVLVPSVSDALVFDHEAVLSWESAPSSIPDPGPSLPI
jgi:predicted ATPase